MDDTIFIKHYSLIKELQEQIINECTKDGIRASIITVFQANENNTFPKKDNYTELKQLN